MQKKVDEGKLMKREERCEMTKRWALRKEGERAS